MLQTILGRAMTDNHHSLTFIVSQKILEKTSHSLGGLFVTFPLRKGCFNSSRFFAIHFLTGMPGQLSVVTLTQSSILNDLKALTKRDFGRLIGALEIRTEDGLKPVLRISLSQLLRLPDSQFR